MAIHMYAQEERATPHTGSLCIAYSTKGRGILPPSGDTAGQGQELASSPNQGCPRSPLCHHHNPHSWLIMCCGQCSWCLPSPGTLEL